MPFKTISVDLDAYRALKSAKQDPRESFSAVIKRTVDAPPASNFSQLLKQLQEFAGKGVFTTAERAEMRRRERQPLRSRSRVRPPSHAS
ncbi:MAG: antitoxin VapB family protein [Opitutaceae bacterium]|nr:antitoxin VapB family protein [Opitutaceae bacterium]